MNGYLLLRDNKQTGPYSKEEIIEKGFKPYDLIWVEGKSAGWRYPGELPEFTAYAPMVEEQPFDRFFKKPSSSTSTSYNSTFNNTVSTPPVTITEKKIAEPVAEIKVAEPVAEIKDVEPVAEIIKEQEQAKVIPIQPRKIFVTLPGSTVIPVATKTQPVASRPIKEEEAKYMPAAVSNIPAQTEREIKQQPTVIAATTVPSYTSFQQTPQFIQDRIQTQEDKLYIKQGKTTPRSYFMGAVAASLLLGGIVIGLLISNAKQSPELQQVENRFNQLQQEKEAKKQDQSLPPSQITNQEVAPSEPEQLVPERKEEVKSDNDNTSIAKTVVNKEPRVEDKAPASKLVSDKEKSSESIIVDTETEKSTPAIRKDPAADATRQNIYQLVSIEGSPYKTGVLGGISNLQLTISNNSLYPIDQVEVLVNYMNIEKKIVKKEIIVINDVAAGEQKTMNVPKSKRGVSVSYSITKINSRALGLAHSGL